MYNIAECVPLELVRMDFKKKKKNFKKLRIIMFLIPGCRHLYASCCTIGYDPYGDCRLSN